MITPARIIQRKRDGKELSREEILDFIQGVTSGEVADYQATAFLMAVFFQGMTLDETVALTEAMLKSGERYDLSHIPGKKADKHSTGGVGDKVSLILAPLAAACGLKVPMMAGRGLGFSGGTLDKLESISGYDVRVPRNLFERILEEVGCAIIGQSEKIAPADKKLYALRDVTATVDCIPLITASILSKKLAEGTDVLVMDVKVGSGAFMKSRTQARTLGKTISQVARKMGLSCRVILTNMSQPLGYAAGNSLEVLESIEVLRDQRLLKTADKGDLSSADLKELTVQLCAHMLELSGLARTLAEGRKLAHARLADGSAWRTFERMVEAQGGSLEQVRDPLKLPMSDRTLVWKAKKRGYIGSMNTETMGRILVELGGGRKRAEDRIDPTVGIVFHRKPGARVSSGEPLATVYLPEKPKGGLNLEALEAEFHKAIDIHGSRRPIPKLILEVLS